MRLRLIALMLVGFLAIAHCDDSQAKEETDESILDASVAESIKEVLNAIGLKEKPATV